MATNVTSDEPFVRALKDGRIVYWDGGIKGVGVRRFKRIGTVAEAESAAQRMLIEQATGANLSIGPGTTWLDLCSQWNKEHKNMTPVGTYRHHRSVIERWIIPTIGDVRLIDTGITTLTAITRAVTTVDDERGKGRAQSTFDGIVASLYVIGMWGIDENWVPDTLFGPETKTAGVLKRARALTRVSGRARIHNDGDNDRGLYLDDVPGWDAVCNLAAAVADRAGGVAKSRERGELYGAGVRISAGTGTRMCELIGMTIPQVLESGELHISHQLNRYLKWVPGEPMPTAPPKGGKKRNAAIWAKVRPDLDHLIAAARERGDDFLLPPMPATTWWADGWGRLLDTGRTEAGWTWPGHYLRHHYGTFSLAKRVNDGYEREPSEVKEWMGHTKLSTTLDTYIQRTTARTGWIE